MNRPSCAALCAAVLAPCALAQAPSTEAPQLPTVVIRASSAANETRQELETEQAGPSYQLVMRWAF